MGNVGVGRSGLVGRGLGGWWCWWDWKWMRRARRRGGSRLEDRAALLEVVGWKEVGMDLQQAGLVEGGD